MRPFGVVLVMAAGVAVGQTPSPPVPAQQRPVGVHCTMTDDKGNVVDCPPPSAPAAAPASPATGKKFPYPGDPEANPDAPKASQAPSAPTKAFPYPGETDSAPAAAGQAGGKHFPYPGEPSTDAPGKSGPPLDDAGSSGSSSSSSSSSAPGYSSSENGDAAGTPADDDDKTPPPVRRKRKAPVVAAQTPSEREAEDVEVAGFYQNQGNFKAAYARGLDAVSLDASDPEAHLALADAARRLGKLDEAQTHYRKCLTLDPLPKVRKAAEKALREMGGG